MEFHEEFELPVSPESSRNSDDFPMSPVGLGLTVETDVIVVVPEHDAIDSRSLLDAAPTAQVNADAAHSVVRADATELDGRPFAESDDWTAPAPTASRLHPDGLSLVSRLRSLLGHSRRTSRICAGTTLDPTLSAHGFFSLLPHQHRGRGCFFHICTGTGLAPATTTTAPGPRFAPALCPFTRRGPQVQELEIPTAHGPQPADDSPFTREIHEEQDSPLQRRVRLLPHEVCAPTCAHTLPHARALPTPPPSTSARSHAALRACERARAPARSDGTRRRYRTRPRRQERRAGGEAGGAHRSRSRCPCVHPARPPAPTRARAPPI